ncbi:hypothetical protein C8R43DRAFT_960883 [Mycena crocata]|nr:hypothetical protein C8R43DRAFT_960883 [Mycena crocata]
MHPCLEIREMVDAISSHLDTTSDSDIGHNFSYDDTHPVASMALTCRTFLGPALDVLWRSSSVERLLRCFPDDLWPPDDYRQPRRDATPLLRPVRLSDWDRVLFYSNRIRHFSVLQWPDLTVAFRALARCFPGNLLPNLQTLHWFHNPHNSEFIHHFLAPGMTRIASVPSFSLLPTLTLMCPNLKHIDMSWRNYSIPDQLETDAITEFLLSNPALESINLPAFDDKAWHHISQLPSLKSLRVMRIPKLPLSSTRDPELFPALHTLELHNIFVTPTTKFLAGCAEIPLTSFDATFQQLPVASETEEFCTALAEGCLPLSLMRLSIGPTPFTYDSDDFDDSESVLYVVRHAAMRPLLRFTNLTSVSIVAPFGCDLDNAAILELACAWTRIETLELSAYLSSPSPPRATIECLSAFAEHCPHLENLRIALDARHSDASSDLTPDACQLPLESLHVEHSPIIAPGPIARFLAATFPRLLKVNVPVPDAGEGEGYAYRERWGLVEFLLGNLSDGEEEEQEEDCLREYLVPEFTYPI